MKVTMRRVKVTQEEHEKLRNLELDCAMKEINTGGLTTRFDSERWIAGVKDILGDRAPMGGEGYAVLIEVASDPA